MERILLLEDDMALGQGIAMALQIPNMEIAVCRTLGEARRALAETAFVLLILDVNLPDGSGLDLLRAQKALRPEPSALGPAVRRAAEQYRPRAEAKQIALTVDVPEGLTAVFDAKWTEEALCNLLDNAVKYTPDGGCVAVRAQAYERFCRVDVADTGCGVAEDEQAKIFGRFYRSPSAAQTPGVGVGLYLTRQILAREGGYVKVSSAPGRGSTFSLFLPRQTPKCDESVISSKAP